jgi:hypothetical protein
VGEASLSLDVDELTWIGAAVIAAQRIEFGLYGIAAHCSHTSAAAKEKRFRALTPETFLRGDPAELKATLGQLIAVFGDEFLIRTADLDRFVDDRNIIIHSYWRSTHAGIHGSQKRISAPLEYLRHFVERSDRLLAVINGFLAHLMAAAAKREGRDFQITDNQRRDMEAYLRHVEQHLTERK